MKSNQKQINRILNVIMMGKSFVFLSSLVGELDSGELREQRRNIHDSINLNDDLLPIYVDEVDTPIDNLDEKRSIDPSFDYKTADTLAYKIQKSQALVIIFSKINENIRGSRDHGYPLYQTSVSMWEIELFYAAIYNKPIYAIVEKGFEEQSRNRLMDCLSLLKLSAIKILDNIKKQEFLPTIECLIIKQPHTNSLNVYAFLTNLYQNSTSPFDPQLNIYDRALGTPKTGNLIGEINEGELEKIISEVKTLNHNQSKITRLYVAYRELAKAPFTEPESKLYLPKWDFVSSNFSNALAWTGVWGHERLGVLYHLRDLSYVRKKMRDLKFDIAFEEIAHPYGAYASAYYSTAKFVKNREQKNEYYKRTIHNLELGLNENKFDTPGLLTIRGSYYVNKFNFLKAKDDFKKAYEILNDKATDEYQLADIESHYAFSLFFSFRRVDGLELIKKSIKKFEYIENSGAKSRAFKKAAYIFFFSGEFGKALEYRRLSKEVAKDTGSLDQLRQL